MAASAAHSSMPARSEDYLALLYRLGEFGVEARLSVIARELGVAPASASRALAKLGARGLVERRGAAYLLTQQGLKRAAAVVRSHRVIERYLTDEMGVDLYRAHYLAHSLEHVAEFGDLVDERLGGPRACPPGNPVPGRAAPAALPLSRVSEGKFRVARVGELGGSLHWARLLGLRPGESLEVEGVRGQRVVVRVAGRRCEIPLEAASFILVEGG